MSSRGQLAETNTHSPNKRPTVTGKRIPNAEARKDPNERPTPRETWRKSPRCGRNIRPRRPAEKEKQAAKAEAMARQDEAKHGCGCRERIESEKERAHRQPKSPNAMRSRRPLTNSLRSAMVTNAGSYQSRLTSRLAQAEQYDVGRSNHCSPRFKNMNDIISPQTSNKPPLFKQLGVRRVVADPMRTLPDLTSVRAIRRSSSPPNVTRPGQRSNSDGRLHDLLDFQNDTEIVQLRNSGKIRWQGCPSGHVARRTTGLMTVMLRERFASWRW